MRKKNNILKVLFTIISPTVLVIWFSNISGYSKNIHYIEYLGVIAVIMTILGTSALHLFLQERKRANMLEEEAHMRFEEDLLQTFAERSISEK